MLNLATSLEPGPAELGWARAETAGTLLTSEIHVWRVALDRGSTETQRLRRVLDDHERERSNTMVFRLHGDRLLVSRAALRLILGAYLQVDAGEVRLAAGDGGKPCLDPCHGASLRFNLSHSHDLALIAFALDREVGIDLEQLRSNLDIDRLSKRFFSTRETRQLDREPAQDRREAFFTTWTRKEAYLKARGEGLRSPLDRFSVETHRCRDPRLLQSSLHPEDVGRWAFRSIEVTTGFVATLVVEGFDWSVRCFDWSPSPLRLVEGGSS